MEKNEIYFQNASVKEVAQTQKNAFDALFLPEKKEVGEEGKTFPTPPFFWRKIALFNKKALFFACVPLYWLIFFIKIINWFEMGFFVFVVATTIGLTLMGKNWGLLNILLK